MFITIDKLVEMCYCVNREEVLWNVRSSPFARQLWLFSWLVAVVASVRVWRWNFPYFHGMLTGQLLFRYMTTMFDGNSVDLDTVQPTEKKSGVLKRDGSFTGSGHE